MKPVAKYAIGATGLGAVVLAGALLLHRSAASTPPPADICTGGKYFYQDACGDWRTGWPGMQGSGETGQGNCAHGFGATDFNGVWYYISGQGPGATPYPQPPATATFALEWWTRCYDPNFDPPGRAALIRSGFTACSHAPPGGTQDPIMRPYSDPLVPRWIWVCAPHPTQTVAPPVATPVPTPVSTGPNPAAPWIEQLARECVTAGCGNGNFCPHSPLTREQGAVWLLMSKHGCGYVPPPCVGRFSDVPCAPSAPVPARPVVRLVTPVAFEQAALVP